MDDRPPATRHGQPFQPETLGVGSRRRHSSVLRAQVGAHDVLVPHDLRSRACRDQLAEVEHRRRLATRRDEAHVMVDEDHERTELLWNAPDHLGEMAGLPVGEARPSSSSITTRGRPTTARAISSSRRSRAPSPPAFDLRRHLEPDEFDRAQDGGAPGGTSLPGVLVDHRHVVEHGELLDRLLRLEGAPQAPAGPPVVDHLEQILSEGADRARRRLDEAGEDVEERRLPGAVRADQAARALRERHAHVVDGRDAGEADREPFDLDHAPRTPSVTAWRGAARASPGPSAPGRPARPGRSAAPAASRRRR